MTFKEERKAAKNSGHAPVAGAGLWGFVCTVPPNEVLRALLATFDVPKENVRRVVISLSKLGISSVCGFVSPIAILKIEFDSRGSLFLCMDEFDRYFVV